VLSSNLLIAGYLLLFVTGCASTSIAKAPVDITSSAPGTTVTMKGETRKLTGTALLDDLMLLARAVIVVDRKGTVRYIQVVPELSHLPDLETAFSKAKSLL
jgi:hypothetical protein